jgi:uncharacterized protein YxeA
MRRYLIILAILIIILIGAYYFVEESLSDKNPPSIVNLSWTPTRENLDKIYDINVTFTARDDRSPISYAELRFIPVEYYYMIEKYGMRPEDYPKVFPPDKERVLILTPVDGKFDSLEEKFSVPIKDIVGGREYRIVILVRDSAGNERAAEVKTPYIRQFENFGSTNPIKTCVTMVPFKELFRGEWDFPTLHKPILNRYSLSDSIVISKHVDFATGYGINCFFIDTQNNYEEITKIISNPLFSENGVSFALLYNSISSPNLKKIDGWKIDFNDENNVRGLKEDFRIIAMNFLNYNNYLKVNNKSVVYLYYSHGYIGDVDRAIDSLREYLKDNFGISLYLFSDVIERYHPLHPLHTDNIDELTKAVLPYDGITLWGGGFSGQPTFIGGDYEEQLKSFFSLSREIGIKNNKGLMLSFKNGENSSLVPWGSNIILPRSPELFRERLEISLKHIKNYPYFAIIRVDTWDDWYEDTQIFPSQEEGFVYLDIIKGLLIRK